MEELIRNEYGQIIAKVKHLPNGDKEIRDFYGRLLGRYDSQSDCTRDFYGIMVAKGDCLGMLIK